MNVQEIELDGRKYRAYVSPDEQQGAYIVVGPPEGLVDALGLPEPFASRLHNCLYARGILTANDARMKPKEIAGALQEALSVDVQLLVEEFFKSNKETL